MRKLRILFSVILLASVLTLVFTTTAFADDCEQDPLNAADCMRSPGFREGIVIIFSTLPTVAAILPNVFGPTASTPPGQKPTDKQPDKPKQTIYAVQVSEQSLEIELGETKAITIKAWKSVDGGPWVSAGEVGLRADFSGAGEGVYVSPNTGQGQMSCYISAEEMAQPGVYPLQITGQAPHSQTSAQVTVTVVGAQHVLQAEPEALEISVGESVELTISAWTLGESGQYEPAKEAKIKPWLPTEKDYFRWEPAPPYKDGILEVIHFRITALDAKKDEELCFLDFTAIFPDKTEIDKRVEINLKAANYRIEFL